MVRAAALPLPLMAALQAVLALPMCPSPPCLLHPQPLLRKPLEPSRASQ